MRFGDFADHENTIRDIDCWGPQKVIETHYKPSGILVILSP